MVKKPKNDYIKLKNNSPSGDIDAIEILAQKNIFHFFCCSNCLVFACNNFCL